jgi:phage terminase large subunit GpA-like protein
MSDLLAGWLADGSVPELPPLPPSLAVEDDAGVSWLLDAVQGGLRPDPRLNVSEWADTHRMLSGKGSAEPGRYRTSRAPFLREIMDSLSPSSPVQRVVFMKGAQIGGSELGNNWLGYIMACAPGPVMAVQPTVELAKRFSKQRVDQLIEATPVLRAKVKPSRARDSGNTILQKDFAGGTLVLTGANSAVGLRSMPARYLFLDEVDAYPADVESEGDPIDLAEARTKTYSFRRKMLLVSTPTVEGRSKIEAEYLASDQRRYFVPCPHCRHMQWLKFPNLKWEKGRPETAGYHCEECGAAATEAHKTAMLAGGEWRETVECRNPLVRGYHVSSLYAPVGWMSWEDIARKWEKVQAETANKVSALKTFINTTLGEVWQEQGDAPEWERLHERAEEYPEGWAPADALAVTAGVDVQGARLELYLWAWGRGLTSWLVGREIFEGDPTQPAVWDALLARLDQPIPREGGPALHVMRAGVDTGFATAAVYAQIRRLHDPRLMPLKGVERSGATSPISGPTAVDVTANGRKTRGGLKIWTVAVSSFKTELYRRLWLKRDGEEFPAGWVHLPRWVGAEAIKQLVAEQLVSVRDKRGFTRQEWRKLRERNEALDCAVYARAALWVSGADRRGERFWDALASELDAPRRVAPVVDVTQQDVAAVPPRMPGAGFQPRAPVRRSGYFGGWR